MNISLKWHVSVIRYLILLKTYLKPQWVRVLLLALSILCSIGLQLLNPQILRFFIDTAIAGGASLSLVYAGLLFIAVALSGQGVAVVKAYLSTNVAWTATNQMRTDLVAHCLALDLGFHKARTPGEMIERVDGDVDTLSSFFSDFVISLLSNVLSLLAVLLLFFTIDWRVGVVMVCFTIIASLILLYLRRHTVDFWKQVRQLSADFYGFLSERLVGTEDIRANGAVLYVMRRFYMLLQDKSGFPIIVGRTLRLPELALWRCFCLSVAVHCPSRWVPISGVEVRYLLAPSICSTLTQISCRSLCSRFRRSYRICNNQRHASDALKSF